MRISPSAGGNLLGNHSADRRASKLALKLSCRFPAEWKEVCGVLFERYGADQGSTVIWNSRNHLVKVVSKDALKWSQHALRESIDPLAHKADLVRNQSRAAAWILRMIEQGQKDIWEGLRDRDSGFLMELWQTVFGRAIKLRAQPRRVCLWMQEPTRLRLRAVSPDGWDVHTRTESIERYMPTPSIEWQIKTERSR